eukprot:10764725-Alexandrium_andersonii.AAC.1
MHGYAQKHILFTKTQYRTQNHPYAPAPSKTGYGNGIVKSELCANQRFKNTTPHARMVNR